MPDFPVVSKGAIDPGGAFAPLASRRSFLGLSLGGLLAACSGGSSDLVVGDQRGGMQTMLTEAGQIASIPYPVKWTEFPNAAPLLEAIGGNAVDIGIGGDAAFIFSLQSGHGVRAISAIRSLNGGTTLMVRRDSPVRTFTDLIGKRIATPKGSTGHFVLLAGLERLGKPLDAIDFVFLSPNDGQAAVASGAVDAWSVWDPYGAIGEVSGALRLVPVGKGWASGVSYLFASERALETKLEQLRDFTRRFRASRTWIAAHPQEHATVLARETGLPIAVARLTVGRGKIVPIEIDDALRREQQGIADLFLKAGLLRHPVHVGPALKDLAA